jgi:hypothetical protein
MVAMRSFWLVLASLSLSALMTSFARAEDASNFKEMIAATGCKSKFSDEKKDDIFKSKYENKDMVVDGEIAEVDRGELDIKVLPSTLTFDLDVTLKDPKSTYDLQKGQSVTVRFIVRSAGGCILPYSGDEGVLVPAR